MARLTLCMIARNEERMLPGCLASAKDAVDEIVLVDTGSTDGTMEIARRAGARVYEQAWADDFAAPRNEALAHATGDWVLQLDADERLAPGAGRVLRRAARKGGFDMGMLRLHDASRLDAHPEEVLAGSARIGPPMRLGRFFRRWPGLRYRGIVHENVDDAVAELAWRIVPVEADLVHFGLVPEIARERGKQERNMALLVRRCALEPDDVTAFGYLALEHLDQGQPAEALRVTEAGWALLDRQPRWRSMQRIAVARAAAALQTGHPGLALEAVDRAEERMGRRSDFEYLRGCALEALALGAPQGSRRRELAARAAEAHAAALRPDASGVAEQIVHQAGTAVNLCRLGCALLVAGRAAEARAAFERALEAVPGLEEARLGVAEARLDMGEARGALVELEPLLGATPDGWALAAAAARRLGARQEAALFAERASERAAAGFLSPHRRVFVDEARAAAGETPCQA